MPYSSLGIGDITEAMYSRQPERVTKLMANTTAAIAGVGGLGTHVALLLARSGIGKLLLADKDVVEPSNLGRQHYYIDQIGLPKVTATEFMMRFLRPGLQVEAKQMNLTSDNFAETFKEADIVFECFDSEESKLMAYNVAVTQMKETPFIMASGVAGIKSGNLIHTKKLKNNVILVGDEQSDLSEGLVAARVVAVAALQVLAGIRVLLKEDNV